MTTPLTAPVLTLSLAQITDINVKGLDWLEGPLSGGRKCYSTIAAGVDYAVFEYHDGTWRYGTIFYPSAEAAITAAEEDYKAHIRGFLEKNLESISVKGIFAFPE
mgnify:CR=1 FL=1|jgi:hypothetical protein